MRLARARDSPKLRFWKKIDSTKIDIFRLYKILQSSSFCVNFMGQLAKSVVTKPIFQILSSSEKELQKDDNKETTQEATTTIATIPIKAQHPYHQLQYKGSCQFLFALVVLSVTIGIFCVFQDTKDVRDPTPTNPSRGKPCCSD